MPAAGSRTGLHCRPYRDIGPPPMTEAHAIPPGASRIHLPAGSWATVLDALCAIFPGIAPETWRDRFYRQRVLDEHGQPVAADRPYREGLRLCYFREVPAEAPIPFVETLIHVDEHLVVADKPPFLPVTPGGGYVEETLLARLRRRLDNPELVPVHRIDRHTRGLVLFSARRDSRSAYEALFSGRRIEKIYEALAAPIRDFPLPVIYRSRLGPGEPFFRMRELPGEANSETRIERIGEVGEDWHYRLMPLTGRKHQLRVQMAALGAPIRHDPFYPDLSDHADDYGRPLALLARALRFRDPLSGEERLFESGQRLKP